MKIKFNSDVKLLLNKAIEIASMIIVVRVVFYENNKYYLQVFSDDEFLYKLHYDRIDVSEEIDVNKRSESKECDICHYWYFLDKDFNFQANFCHGSHDLLMTSVNLSHFAILNIKGYNYCCSIS